ncbi:MAG: isoleucine--tRNA ligase, partial [Endozoicomonadaceae bacterium]|nr:isoleucine--tRNA ligase [Endozoicomonadaceae bacterium]
HLGHTINKVLKDIIVKSKTLSGFDAPYVPGWDCHGLPIEHKVEQKKGKAGVKIDKKAFRQACREYALKQVFAQREDFKRLGILGDWQNPYLTMDFTYEANIVRALAKIIANGHLQRGYKPVYWSVVGQSALADAEVEYREKISASVYVRYPITDTAAIFKAFSVAATPQIPMSILIWTTTPWTLPSSLAITLGAKLNYVLVECETESGSELLILNDLLLEQVMETCGIKVFHRLAIVTGAQLENLTVNHPFYDRKIPLLNGDHVTTDAGTGCVHTAPDHGVDDFNIAKRYNIETLNYINDAGVFRDNVEYFAGEHVYKVDDKVINLLQQKGYLLYSTTFSHSYPHCWRTKTPLIFRATPQWFISMTQNHLLKKCQDALETVVFTPKWGRRRMETMLENSPDWCISRQRTWGVPITLFVHKETYALHPDTVNLMEQIALRIEKAGIDDWYNLKPIELLPPNETENYIKVTDTLDVWFDSGVTHAAVLQWKGLGYPADLYLEGSDQHRGWFQSSLKTGMAINGASPYKNLLTHGFTVDEKGHKMSKSLGNVITPKEIINELGCDVLRLWVASVDYSTDMGVTKGLFKQIAEAYRRIRNTARFLLANMHGFDPEQHKVPADQLLPLDAWAVDCAYRLQQEICEAYDQYSFNVVYQKLYNFCITDLGGFFLDIIKDRQYTTQENSRARRSCQTALYHIAEALVRWIAPVLSFTAEELWKELPGKRSSSVHMSLWYEDLAPLNQQTFDHAFWQNIISVRTIVNKALEAARKTDVIGSSLEAEVILYADTTLQETLSQLNNELHFILITSKAEVRPLSEANSDVQVTDRNDLKISIKSSAWNKCIRCWHHCEEVGEHTDHPQLCARCISNVDGAGENRCFA